MSFLAELKRRNVIRVGIAYAVVGWLVSQVAEFAIETFGAPDWVLKIFVVFLLLGFPIVVLFAWAFEMTPEGIKLEKHVDRSQSITRQTGRKLDYTIIAVLAIALAYFVWESRFSPGQGSGPISRQSDVQGSEPIPRESPAQPGAVVDGTRRPVPRPARSRVRGGRHWQRPRTRGPAGPSSPSRECRYR